MQPPTTCGQCSHHQRRPCSHLQLVANARTTRDDHAATYNLWPMLAPPETTMQPPTTFLSTVTTSSEACMN